MCGLEQKHRLPYQYIFKMQRIFYQHIFFIQTIYREAENIPSSAEDVAVAVLTRKGYTDKIH